MDLAEVRQRLAETWGTAVPVRTRYVVHHERVVFDTVDPSGRRVVAKADVDPARLAREARVLRAVREVVPVPEVLLERLGLVVLSWVAGEPLLTTSPAAHWVAAGRTLRRLHDLPPVDGIPGYAGSRDWWGWLLEWLDTAYPAHRAAGHLPGAVLDRLFGMLDAAYREAARHDAVRGLSLTRLLHGDCGTWHWRVRPDGTAAMIDFGEAGTGDPLWDIAVLVHWDPHRLPAVLDGYGADSALRQRARRLLLPYRITRHLRGLTWLVDHGYDPAATVAELVRLSECPAR